MNLKSGDDPHILVYGLQPYTRMQLPIPLQVQQPDNQSARKQRSFLPETHPHEVLNRNGKRKV
jgi:hypothetical protein